MADEATDTGRKPKPTDTLKPESLEWALAHLLTQGDSDLVPVPFEYKAIKADWAAILPKLLERDLTTVSPGAHQTFLVPKPAGAFRVVTRLDPIDALLYTAAVFECAGTVEKARAKHEVACAYRIDPDLDGRLFSVETGWDVYVAESTRLAAENGVTHIVTADIADFYSQVSHHRVGGSLEGAGVPRIRAQAIEKMLGGWSALQSRGVPVGPYASILLAEAILIDVDAHLSTGGYKHVRYVDDFRIFCGSYSEALRAQHDLSEFLYTAHRLALNPNKTRTYRTETFVTKVLDNPAFAVRDKKLRIVKDAMAAWAAAGYTFDAADVAEGVEDVDVLVALFEECIGNPPLRLGLSRYLFRRAAKLRTNRIQSLTLKSLDVLTPILREVLFYLERSTSEKSIRGVAKAVLAFGLTSDFAFMPVVQEWVVDAAAGFLSDALTPEELLSLSKPAKAAMGLRGEAMLALARKDVPWIRARKENWRSAGPWERRAIIAAGAILPGDERSAWKKSVITTTDLLDHAVAVWALRS